MESKTSVLVVDDDKSLTTILESYLYVKNVEVKTVNSAIDAIETLRNQEFDVILTDVYMPNINGFEFILWLKKNNVKSHIIVMTAQSNEKAKEVYHNYGILKYLSKPFELTNLLELINQIDKNGFKSSITEVTLFDYIQIMGITKKTNILYIESPFSDINGYLYFKDGEIIEAEYGNYKGEEAFFKIIKIGGGTISEVEKDFPQQINIDIPVMSLLFKATQLIDEENLKNKKINNNKYNILFLHSNSLKISEFKEKFMNDKNIDFKIANSDTETINELQNRYFDLIVGDSLLLRDNGPEILIWLRTNNVDSKIIILVDKSDDKLNNFSLNNEFVIFMVKPLDMDKLEDFIKSDISTGFSGNINEITLFDYIQMIALSKKSKTISINSPIAYTEGKLYFKNGNLINAEYDNLTGIDAVFKMMTITGGIISELNINEEVEQTINLSLPALLMKATNFIEQESLKKSNLNIDDKVIESINKKISAVNNINNDSSDTDKVNNYTTVNNSPPKTKPDLMINKSIFGQKNNVETNTDQIRTQPIKENGFKLLNINRWNTVKAIETSEEGNNFLISFHSLKSIIPSLSEKGINTIKDSKTDISIYQMLKKIDGKSSLDDIYQNNYHHLELIDFFNKFETVVNLVTFNEIDKNNLKPTIFQILVASKLITTERLKQIINVYLDINEHSKEDKNFIDGSFLVEAGCITSAELTKTILFINKFNRFLDNFF